MEQKMQTWTARVWVTIPGSAGIRRIITFTVQAPTLTEAKLMVQGQYGRENVLAVV